MTISTEEVNMLIHEETNHTRMMTSASKSSFNSDELFMVYDPDGPSYVIMARSPGVSGGYRLHTSFSTGLMQFLAEVLD